MAESADAGRFRAVLAAASLERGLNRLTGRVQSTEAYAFEIGCEVPEIAMPHAFRAEDRLVVVLMSGGDRPDPARLAAAVGVEIGDADQELVRAAAEWAIRSRAPPEPLTPIDVFMDARLFQFDEIWAVMGNPISVTPIAPSHLRDATEANVAALHET